MSEPIDFLHYLDRIHDLMKDAERRCLAYAEECCCGASIEIGCEVPARERTQAARMFIARHQHCTQPGRDADINTEALP